MRKLLCAALVAVLVLSAVSALADGPIEVTMLKSAGGNDTHIELWRELVPLFEAYTGGKYTLKMEEIPGVAVDVRTKYKMLNAANNLPAIVTDLGAEPAFADLLIANDRVIDLKPFFDASPEWQATALPASVEYNTKDGKMFTAPATTSSYVGVYYNKELFAQAGIESFPATWDEFWAACEKLKAKGIPALSLHTTETGWCAMLWADAYLGTTDAGNAFIQQRYPTNFDDPAFIDAMKVVRKLFDYTTSDAVGGNYPLAANNFCTGKTAMIANGPWMADSLYDPQYSPEGFADKVGYATFPGKIMLSDQGQAYGNAISKDVSAEQQQGAVEFFKFLATPDIVTKFMLAEGSMTHLVKLSDDQLAQLNGVLQESAKAVGTIEKAVPVFQAKWDPIVQNEVIVQELPNLAMDAITPEQFAQKMVEGAKRYATEGAGK